MHLEIEGKWLFAGWTGVHGQSLISIAEQVKGPTFRVFITKDCTRWLVGELG